VHRRRVGVVGGLRLVDVVVRVDGLLITDPHLMADVEIVQWHQV
jgi:hypothetical protein